ncbi:MAG: putative Ig domain-containing protein [Streptosporangiales bacterium]
MRSRLGPREADDCRRGGNAMTITVGGSPPRGMVDDAYYAELTAAGGTPPYTWAHDTPLPDGLELATLPDTQQAAIRGVPAKDGSTQCTIRVTDSTGDTVPYEVSLDIDPRLTISTHDLPPGVEGKPYTATLNAAGEARLIPGLPRVRRAGSV